MFNSYGKPQGKPKSQLRKRQTKHNLEVKSKEIRYEAKSFALPSQNDTAGFTQKPSIIFNHPMSISNTWDLDALKKVDTWLREYISKLPIGKIVEVKPTAIYSKKFIASITPERNSQGVRYLLWNLHLEGYINFPDNLQFVILKRIE